MKSAIEQSIKEKIKAKKLDFASYFFNVHDKVGEFAICQNKFHIPPGDIYNRCSG